MLDLKILCNPYKKMYGFLLKEDGEWKKYNNAYANLERFNDKHLQECAEELLEEIERRLNGANEGLTIHFVGTKDDFDYLKTKVEVLQNEKVNMKIVHSESYIISPDACCEKLDALHEEIKEILSKIKKLPENSIDVVQLEKSINSCEDAIVNKESNESDTFRKYEECNEKMQYLLKTTEEFSQALKKYNDKELEVWDKRIESVLRCVVKSLDFNELRGMRFGRLDEYIKSVKKDMSDNSDFNKPYILYTEEKHKEIVAEVNKRLKDIYCDSLKRFEEAAFERYSNELNKVAYFLDIDVNKGSFKELGIDSYDWSKYHNDDKEQLTPMYKYKDVAPSYPDYKKNKEERSKALDRELRSFEKRVQDTINGRINSYNDVYKRNVADACKYYKEKWFQAMAEKVPARCLYEKVIDIKETLESLNEQIENI